MPIHSQSVVSKVVTDVGEKGPVAMQQLAESFWNFRGAFRIAKVLDIGTQMSLVRRANGRFILIDSYDLDEEDRGQLFSITDNGAAIEAIINVHPFHTCHCAAAYQLAPSARLIGTRRHREQAPDLPWETNVIEDRSTQDEFSDDLDFSIPDGLDLVTADENVHAGSVLLRHRMSGIVHVDDTINVFAAPGILSHVFPQTRLRFHPMLAKALQKRPGAATEYATWARAIAERWAGTPIVCAAHSAVRRLPENGWRTEILHALSGVEKMLAKHRALHG